MRSFTYLFAILSFYSSLTCVDSFLSIGIAQERDASQKIKPDELVNSIGMQLVQVPAGEFQMGAWEDAEAKPAHIGACLHIAISNLASE